MPYHHYPEGSLVLVKVEGHPYWPAKVLDCLKNGGYNVVFFGEKSEADVLPHMIAPFTPTNVEKLKNKKEYAQNRHLKEAIKLTQRISEEREKGNYQFEDDALMSKSKTLIRKKPQETVSVIKEPQQPQHQDFYLNIKKTLFYGNIYIELKVLLDKFSKCCFQMKIPNPNFTEQNQERLLQILMNEKLLLQNMIQKFVIERMIITIMEIEHWGLPESLEDLFLALTIKYREFEIAVLSQEFLDLHLDPRRSQYLLKQVKEFRMRSNLKKHISD